MQQILLTIQIILAILLTSAILLQQRGTALGEAFGGDSAIYRTRRGVEKFLFVWTIVIALLFVASIIASLLV